MTAQIQDRVWYQDEEYVIVGVKGSGLFIPQDFGMAGVMMSTGCYRGFYVTYGVEDGEFRLETMTIRAANGDYKPINGIKPVMHEWQGGVYSRINLRVPFTGRLLLGKDFIGSMYVHMGFQKPPSYETVIELMIDHGVVLSSVDHSTSMADIRTEMQRRADEARSAAQSQSPEERRGLDMERMQQWIDWMFSLDYDLDE